MQKLTDKEIRQALIAHLKRRKPMPLAALEEVHVCNGNAIADVVAVYKSMHCYEIKGETDSITRIERQSNFFDQAFPLISLVTTANHLRTAEKSTPKHWGIILASPAQHGEVSLRYVRGATKNNLYRPEVALLTLWRSELVALTASAEKSLDKMNRQSIASLVALTTPTRDLNELLGKALAARPTREEVSRNNLAPYK